MSSSDTKALIVKAVERLQDEVPSLRRLTLVLRLELRAHGGDAPIWRVEVPGPDVRREPVADGRLDVTVSRAPFNELAAEGKLKDWAKAYERGDVRVTGDSAVMKLLGSVFERQMSRAKS